MKNTFKFIILLSTFAWGGMCYAQLNPVSVEDLFVKRTFGTKGVRGLRSMNNGEDYTVIEGDNKKIVKYSYKSGKALETLFDADDFKESGMGRIDGYEFSHDESRLLIATRSRSIYRNSFVADYFIFDFKNRDMKPLSEHGGQQLATFSPDGMRIAFVRENNIFVHDLRFGSERQITSDGKSNHVINGAPDWVYEEEFEFSRAYEWAPDGSALGYIKFNESAVREYSMQIFEGQHPAINQNELYPSLYSYKYPKAGEKNATVSVHVYDFEDRTTMTMDTQVEGDRRDHYIPRIRWSKDPKKLAIIRLNRIQNRMEILLANVRTGKTTVLYREENKYYIDEKNFDNLVFLDNGTEFVITSEKSGYMHLYLYNMSGQEKRAITSGAYDIADFYGYDNARKLFYYSSHEESPLEKQVYSVNLKGNKTKITPAKGWNDVNFSRTFNYYTSTHSGIDTPPVTALFNAKNKQLRVLEDNHELNGVMASYRLAKREFMQIPAADNRTMLNAWIMKPVDFDAGKKYPVVMTQYSGPNSQQVRDAWGGINWLHYLAQEGFIVVCVDPRGTGARGEEFRKCTYMQLGKLESDDLIASARWLAGQTYIDGKNIAIWGWSYGGFMSSTCIMKGNDVFSTAIAVAPVTNFKYYDSVYAERFLRTPAENEAGYEENAPVNMAGRLKGNLLLCHGMADDNVHVQNTYELAERLVQANKQFDMAIYTNRNHSIYGGNTQLQLYTKFINYLKNNLK